MLTTDVGVLDKVVSLLSLFDERTRTLDPATAAKRSGMSTPTAYRLMKAMSVHGLLNATGKGYELGLELLHLGQLVSLRLDIVAVARPHMEQLRDTVNETVELQVRSGHSRVPVHLESSTRTVRSAAQVGLPLPLHKGASSRPLIAWLPDDDAVRLATESARADGDDLDIEAYLERLEAIRRRGFDVGLGERDPESAAAAAPVFDRTGAVCAILVVSSTVTRFANQEHQDATIAALLNTTAAVTSSIGGRPPV